MAQRWKDASDLPPRGHVSMTTARSHERLLVDPHERARVVGFALVLDAVEAVAPLAVVPLVVVVVLHLPHRLKEPRLRELEQEVERAR